MGKLITSARHPMGNGGKERVNHTMVHLLSMFLNERQSDWDEQLSHNASAFNNSVNTAYVTLLSLAKDVPSTCYSKIPSFTFPPVEQ